MSDLVKIKEEICEETVKQIQSGQKDIKKGLGTVDTSINDNTKKIIKAMEYNTKQMIEAVNGVTKEINQLKAAITLRYKSS